MRSFNIIGKLFTLPLNQRLLDWAESANLITEAQYGFRQGRRTTHAIFILNTAFGYAEKPANPSMPASLIIRGRLIELTTNFCGLS